MTTALVDEVRSLAATLGFERVGVARAEALGPEADALRRFLAEGRHASMEWLSSNVDVRVDPRHDGMVPGARSVVVLAAPYAGRDDEAPTLAPGRIARYARGRDYHNVLGKSTRKIADLLERHGHAARAAVDTKPVLERAWAQRAGVGFVGKNCCVIVPGIGSHVFLACVVTTAELPIDAPMEERCGACTRCLDACPTRAFVAERTLDARRCVSYLTIEHEGPIDASLREGIGDWLFGCDACQDVCPYNRTGRARPRVDGPFAADARLGSDGVLEWLRHDEPSFAARTNGTPLKRPGRAGFARNAAIVLGNAGEKRHLPVLVEAAERDPDEIVRDAARWAIERIASRGS